MELWLGFEFLDTDQMDSFHTGAVTVDPKSKMGRVGRFVKWTLTQSENSLSDAGQQKRVFMQVRQRYFQWDLPVFQYKLQLGSQITVHTKNTLVKFTDYCASKLAIGVKHLTKIVCSDENNLPLSSGMNK